MENRKPLVTNIPPDVEKEPVGTMNTTELDPTQTPPPSSMTPDLAVVTEKPLESGFQPSPNAERKSCDAPNKQSIGFHRHAASRVAQVLKRSSTQVSQAYEHATALSRRFPKAARITVFGVGVSCGMYLWNRVSLNRRKLASDF